MAADETFSDLARYPLLDALRDRRSRRFGLGMKMDVGPMVYESAKPGLRLSEDEEAALAFAACGVTGPALGDLVYEPGHGGAIMAGMAGRTIASGDAIQTVSVFVTNDDATYWLRRSEDFPAGELGEVVELARDGKLTELYRRSRVKIKDGRARPPLHPMYNLSVNHWALYDSASSYFLPVGELTLLYINGVMEILGEDTGAFIVDERAGFRPAGLGRFAKSRGGHLNDDPAHERVLTIQQLEGLVSEFVTIEMGMALQNLGLMTQAMGLGGFPHWAAHPFGWLEALGFRMKKLPATQYLGMNRTNPILAFLARMLGKDSSVGYGLGLELDGEPLLVPYCPPWYPSMKDAVRAVFDRKFGPNGVFRGKVGQSAFKEPSRIAEVAKEPSATAVEATTAFCEYVFNRYGRFPAYSPPIRTVLGYQASHLDLDFYERFYRPEALSPTQREHMKRWHGET